MLYSRKKKCFWEIIIKKKPQRVHLAKTNKIIYNVYTHTHTLWIADFRNYLRFLNFLHQRKCPRSSLIRLYLQHH